MVAGTIGHYDIDDPPCLLCHSASLYGVHLIEEWGGCQVGLTPRQVLGTSKAARAADAGMRA